MKSISSFGISKQLFIITTLCTMMVARSILAQQAIFRGNAQLTGELSNTDPVQKLTGVKFTFETNGPLRAMPIADNDRIYLASSDQHLYVLNASTGKELWRFKTQGAITGSPTIVNDVVYFSSRDGFVYALDVRSNGKVLWKFKMQPDLPFNEGYDYFLSSPNIEGNAVYIGSGDGNMYALHSKTGKLIWKFNAKARIRTTPAVYGDKLFFGALNGIVYALNKATGAMAWKYATKGAGLKFEDVGYDQKSIIASPAVNANMVLAGGRDGFLYALDINTGVEKWKVSHGGSWVLGISIDDKNVYASSGSASFVQAVDLTTGKEVWRFPTKGIVYATPTLVGNTVYVSDYNGGLYAVNKHTGEKKWSFPLGARSLATPLIYRGKVYAGADNGLLHVLEGTKEDTEPRKKARKIVYWQGSKSDAEFSWFENGSTITARDYFKNVDYEVVDAVRIRRVVNELIESKAPSVIVFADNRFPAVLIDTTANEPLIRKYLNNGGKVVLIGPNPLGFQKNPDSGQLTAIDFGKPVEKVFGIKILDRDFVNVGSIYPSWPTDEGIRWGLRGWWISASSIEPSQVTTVLATNDYGMATSWLKSFGGPKGTGLLQLWIPTENRGLINSTYLSNIQAAAEYGIEW